MGWDVLEAQVAGHAFDGELGAGYGVNNRQRAVNHVAGAKLAVEGMTSYLGL